MSKKVMDEINVRLGAVKVAHEIQLHMKDGQGAAAYIFEHADMLCPTQLEVLNGLTAQFRDRVDSLIAIAADCAREKGEK
jgi:hypothetical protein